MSFADYAPPPPFLPDLARPRVAATLAAALEKPLVALLAPGGFGKTCVLRSFWNGSNAQGLWLDAASRTPAAILEALAASVPQLGRDALIIIDGVEHFGADTLGRLVAFIERLPRGLRLILAGRAHQGLPLSLWRSQGRLASLNAHHLALSSEEWAAAGLEGEAEDWAGWWGARQAAALPLASWDNELAEWLEWAWLGALDAATVADLGRAALLPEASPESMMALGAGSQAQADKALLSVATLAGPLCVPGGGVRLAPRFRPYLVAAWRRRDPQGWQQALTQGTASLLARGLPALAARMVLETSDAELGGELARQVIQEAGWTLLFNRNRPLLRALLDATATDVGQPHYDLYAAAWTIEVEKRPHEAEESIIRLTESLLPEVAGPAYAFRASMSLQYDGFDCALAHAEAAMEALSDNHPAFMLAELVAATSALACGQLDTAERALTHVLACADRDRLDHLQLEALHRRAIAAFERGLGDSALKVAGERRKRAQLAGLASSTTQDASARLEAALYLRRLDTASATRLLAAGQGAHATLGDYWDFPYVSLEAIAQLIDGEIAPARAGIAHLEALLAERFYCLKWRADLLLPRIWLRAADADRDGLLKLASYAQAEIWPDTLYRDRRDLYCIGAQLLAGERIDPAPLAALIARRSAQGASDVATLAQRLHALACEDRDMLLQAVQASAAQGETLDWLWLAPRALGPLEQLLTHPALANDTPTRTYLREVVQRLLAPRASADTAPAEGVPAAPPAGLTVKEWKILQLIGAQLTNEQIATQLFVSLATVKTHINHLYAKLDIRTRAEAIHRARTLGQG